MTSPRTQRGILVRRIVPAAFLAVLIGLTFWILNRSQFRTVEGHVFGTTYHIKYSATRDLSADIESALCDVDAALSMFNPESTLSLFNAGVDYAPNRFFDDVVTLGLQISKETDGAFDMTVAPLVNAWGFGFKNREDLTDAQIDSIREFVGYDKLTFNAKATPTLKRSDSRVTIDCGAIAKGYGVQSVAQMLESKGCRNFMVEIGGEVVVKGTNPDGKKWTLGITKPIDDPTNQQAELQETIAITDRAVATSGNYRNFYMKGERKYAHTIDPATGYPVEHSLLSATVIHPNCAAADAYATAFMVMGLEQAQHFVENHKDLEAYLIYSDDQGNMQIWQSSRFARYLHTPKH